MFKGIFPKRLSRALPLVAVPLLCLIFGFSAFVSESFASSSRGTNVTIDTNDSGPISLNEKIDPENQRPVIYKDGDVALDFNENS